MNTPSQQTENPHRPHLLKSMFYSRQPMALILKKFIVLGAILLVLVTFARSALTVNGRRKDCIQDILMGKAVLAGLNPYLPGPELMKRLKINMPYEVYPHPNPHPPPVIFAALPFGFFTFRQAIYLWFLMELACVAIAAYWILVYLGARQKIIWVLSLALIMISCGPFQEELFYGQLTSLLLIFLMGACLALGKHKDGLGGIYLGSALAIKLIAWPLVLFLALRKRWRAAITALTTFALANLAAAWFIGLEGLRDYYLKVGPSVSTLCRAHAGNSSLCSIGWRLFEGTGSSLLPGIEAPPLVYAPKLAQWVSFALPLMVLSICLWLALRARNFDLSFGIMVCLTILVSPWVWPFYFILLVIPLAIAGHCLSLLDFPKKETNIVLAVALSLYIPNVYLHRFVLLFAQRPPIGLQGRVSWGISMLTLLPNAILLALIYVLWRMDRKCPEKIPLLK
jgi:Glycosyltransferase family 87